ncbi:hypothetical protein GG344DRAFT_40164, partial [Lentinula edodes]
RDLLGNLTGAESWQTSGKQGHAEGETEYKAAQAEGIAEGAKDEFSGYICSVTGAITDDKTKQTSGNIQKETGKAQKEANKQA